MIADPLQRTLEATGYLLDGHRAAPGVSLADSPTSPRLRTLSPDAWWRAGSPNGANGNAGASKLTVLFKFTERPDGQVADWQRDAWNLGFAPLLWVVSPNRTEIYNGFGTPQPPGEVHRNRLRTFGSTPAELDDLNTYAGRLAMETGRFWQRSTKVDRKTGVDAQLLAHLGAVERDLVADELDPLEAQGLIGRTVFTRYLLDRKIVGAQELHDLCGYADLPDVLKDRSATQRLFNWLRTTFNDDMFPANLRVPSVRHLCRVADFLRADGPAAPMSLFPYRFDVIPVELISSIYERFVHQSANKGQGAETGHRRSMGCYYTPLTAVSMVLDEVFDGLTGDETVIDLTCGSGVFLVEALRRLVRLKAKGGTPTREMVRRTLYEQVYGVEVSEPAIRIAAMNLYLAALELDPDPRDPLSRRFEPLVGRTLLTGDAHAIEETVDGRRVLTTEAGLRKFDVVVGNPPWTRGARGGTPDRRVPVTGSRRLSLGHGLDFVQRGRDFAHAGTRFGMLVSANPFLADSAASLRAAQETVEALAPVTLINLSDLSHWLFDWAKMPVMALIAGNREQNAKTMHLVHLPRSPEGARSRTIGVGRGNVATLPLESWQRNRNLLKTAFVGGQHDLLLMDSLVERFASLQEQLHTPEARFPSGATRASRPAEVGRRKVLLVREGKRLKRFASPMDLPEFERAERPREGDIYRLPTVLINGSIRGPEGNLAEGRPVVSIEESDMVHSNTFGVAFSGTKPDSAHLLAGILSSALASWYVLMAGSGFGIGRPNIRLRDVATLPTPDLEDAIGTDAGARVIRLVRRFHDTPPDDRDWRALDDAVFELYQLDQEDRIVVADGRLRATWQWKSSSKAADEGAEAQHLESYARAFLLSMDAWLYAANERRFLAEIHDTGPASPLRVVRFVLEDHPPPSRIVLRPEVTLRDLLRDIDTRFGMSIARELVGAQELRIHSRREVVIVKPAARRYWLGVSGLDDARAVLVKSLGGGGG